MWAIRSGAAGAITAAMLVSLVGLVRAAELERYDALANSAMSENRPAPETSKLLKDELLFQRATQTYLWALPLINTLGMKVGSERTFGWLQRPSRLEEAPGRQDVGDDTKLRRHLRDELP